MIEVKQKKSNLIDDIDTEIIAMHYGIVWGERQRVFPQDFPLILWEYFLSFPPYNTIMHCDNFSIDIVYLDEMGKKKLRWSKKFPQIMELCVKTQQLDYFYSTI